MGFIKEFKEFAMKGNLVDMAVAFVMGAAFSKVSSAFIDGMIMPVVGQLTSGQDFSKMKYVMTQAVTDASGKITAPEVAISYGTFISEVLNFIIVALVMFMVIKAINNMKKVEEAAPAAPAPPPAQEVLLTEIRDLLKK
jgi:large conductance mechanosensitive channel